MAEVIMFPQPWREGGANLREMIADPEGWQESRKGVDTIGYWPWLMERDQDAESQKRFFRCLKDWNKKLQFEVPIIKSFGWKEGKPPLDADEAFAFYMAQDRMFKKNGLVKVDSFCFDEPVYAARVVIPADIAGGQPPVPGFRMSDDPRVYIDYACRETAKFMKLMKKEYPEARYMDIEPYPALSLEELKYSVDILNRECKRLRIKGPDALRIDVDWGSMEAGVLSGSWAELGELAGYVRSRGMDFSLIYWAANQPSGDISMHWRNGVLHMLDCTEKAGLKPDEYVLESWIQMPNAFGPETDQTAYAGCLRDWLKLIKK
ncbi:MAG: hypothetical protein IK083_05340 [Abditibacteriota bacterium]|nr:hypothetical protein [Abditibacteriota bacterium]